MASPFSLYFILFSSTGSSRDSSIWQPPWGTYDHEDFCETLSTVLGLVDVVIWLPRSRQEAHGTYQASGRLRTPAATTGTGPHRHLLRHELVSAVYKGLIADTLPIHRRVQARTRFDAHVDAKSLHA
uniref:Uncharacterized protein n=1 Tax=Chrysotila carterae TaxID=13221 RepID=A0A7S4BU95_CHRCT